MDKDKDPKDAQGSDDLEESFFSSEAAEETEPVVERKGPLIRSPILMVVMIGLCVWLMVDFKEDILYFFSPRQVMDLGDGVDVGKGKLSEPCSNDSDCDALMICQSGKCSFPVNRYARITGIPLITRVSKSTVWGETRNYFPLMGSRNRIFISVARNEKERKKGVIPRRPYKGRLRDLRSKDYRMLREYYLEKFGTKFPDRCYILVDGSEPGDKYPFVVLYVFLGLLVLFNLYTLYKYIAWSKAGSKAGG